MSQGAKSDLAPFRFQKEMLTFAWNGVSFRSSDLESHLFHCLLNDKLCWEAITQHQMQILFVWLSHSYLSAWDIRNCLTEIFIFAQLRYSYLSDWDIRICKHDWITFWSLNISFTDCWHFSKAFRKGFQLRRMNISVRQIIFQFSSHSWFGWLCVMNPRERESESARNVSNSDTFPNAQ